MTTNRLFRAEADSSLREAQPYLLESWHAASSRGINRIDAGQRVIRMNLGEHNHHYHSEPPRNDEATRTLYRIFGAALETAVSTDDFTPLIGMNPPQRNSIISALRSKSTTVCVCGDCGRITQTLDENLPSGHKNDVGQPLNGASIEDDYVGRCCVEKYMPSDQEDFWIHREHATKVYFNADEYYTVSERWAERHARFYDDDDHDTDWTGGNCWMTSELYTSTTGEQMEEAESYSSSSNPFAHGNACAIANYHSSKKYIQQLPSPEYDKLARPLRIGIELEMEIGSGKRHAAARQIKQLMNAPLGKNIVLTKTSGTSAVEPYMLIERDGSVSNGFEMVTAWTGLDTHERILSRFASPEFKKIQAEHTIISHDTTTCGLHVTIDKADMTQLHQAKLMVFLNHATNKKLVMTVCRRYAEGYCKVKPDAYEKVGRSGTVTTGDRYELLNVTKPGVLEFRGPKGTLRFESIMAAIEFIRTAWMFTENTSAGNLTTKAFIEYMNRPQFARETKYLREYLAQRKFEAVPKESRVGTGRLTLTEAHADAMAMGFIAKPKDV